MRGDASGVRALRVLPALIYAAGIFYGGVIDAAPLPETPAIPADKLLHALVFLGFEWMLEAALLELRAPARRAAALGLALAVGGGLELVQSALPHRSGDVWDFVADALGAFVGALLLWSFRRLLPGRRALTETRS